MAFSRTFFSLLFPCTSLAAYAACSDSSTPSSTLPDAHFALDAASVDAVSSEDASGDAPLADVFTDASGDSADTAPPPFGLYAHIAGKLVSLDPATGAVTEIGATGQKWIVLAWDDAAKVVRAIADPYSPVAGAATPKLATVNLCTGALTTGPMLTLNAAQVRRAEGLARHPATGTFFVTYGTAGTASPTEFISEANGTVDVATGAITAHGLHDTLQDDGDLLFFQGNELRLLDIASVTNQGTLYSLDQTTGAATKLVDVGPKVLRVAYDSSRATYFMLYGEANSTGRGLGTIDLSTGVFTKIGAGLADGTYPAEPFSALVAAPKPVCP